MAEKRVIELEIQDNSKTLKAQYKEAVLEVQKLAAAYGETSQQVADAAKKAAGLKDQIEDTNDAIAAFKGEGKFAATGKALSAVASGFSAVEGGMALVGVESENLQKTMLKVQAAMALAQGLEGLEDAGRAFKQLGTVAVNALKGVRGALIATGIGALVVALGTIVAYWDDIKAAVSGVTSEQEALNAETEKNVLIENEKLTSLNSQDNILKLQGLSEKEILRIKIKQIDATIAATEEQIKQNEVTAKLQEEATLRNFKIAKQVISAITKIALIPITAMVAQVDLLIKGANYVSEALGGKKLIDLEPLKEANKYFDKMAEGGAKLLFDPEEVKAEGEKVKKETEKQLQELKNTKAGYQLAIKEIDKQGTSNVVSSKKDELDALIELEIQKANTDENILRDLLQKRLDLEKLSGAQLELAQNENAEKLKQAIEDDKQEIIKLETKSVKDIQAIKLQGQLNEIATQKEIDQIKLDSYQQYLEEVKKKEQEELDAQKLAQQQRVDLILKYAQTFGQAMSSLNGLLNANDEERLKNVKKGSKEEEEIKRKMFDRDKKLRIVQTVIDTASNVVQSIRNGGGIPTGIPFGIAAAAMGALQIATISKAKFDGGGDQVQSPSAGGGAMAPNFNVIGSSGVNQLAQIQQQPTRAYVVSGDVANGLSLERNRLQNASF
jgi:hypothetical protein